MKNNLVLISFCLLEIFGCKKENNPEPVPSPQPNPDVPAQKKSLIPMKKGNYWIYQEYSRDSAGNIVRIADAVDSLVLDSVNGFLDFKLFRKMPSSIIQSSLTLYPLGVISDSGSYYQVKDHQDYIISKSNLPFTSEKYYQVQIADTTYALKFTLSQISNPLPGNVNKTILMKIVIPKAYLVQGNITNNNIWIENVGLYQWEASVATAPYPNLARRLLRYKVNQN